MAEENVEVVLRSLDAFDTDEQAWLETVDPEFEWYPVEEGHIPAHGYEGARGVRERWLESGEGHSGDVEDVKAKGEHVVTTVHLTGRGRESGIEVDIRLHMHWKLRDGRIVYLYEHADRDEALRAAGLD
jgi:ketosteroid isomerase-like protein